MLASRQPHRELGEIGYFALDRDGATVLHGYDLVAYRKAKPRSFPGRLGCEERLEQSVAIFRRNPDAIVTHTNLDALAELVGRNLERRAKRAGTLAATLGDDASPLLW